MQKDQNSSRLEDILDKVSAERVRQDRKWGERNDRNEYWLSILMEEVGEAARKIVEQRTYFLDQEVIQIAAVAVAWAECLQRGRDRRKDMH